MGGFNLIAALDQAMGCYAMSAAEEDQQCLGTITPWQICACNRLHQGLKTAADFY